MSIDKGCFFISKKTSFSGNKNALQNGIICINEINGRYPEKGYCSNLECEELCHILEGNGTIYKRDNELFRFKKGDIIFIHKKDVYYWEGSFKLAIVCTPAWNKEQCKLFDE